MKNIKEKIIEILKESILDDESAVTIGNTIYDTIKGRPLSMVWIPFDSNDRYTFPIVKGDYFVFVNDTIKKSRWNGTEFTIKEVSHYALIMKPNIYNEDN